MFFKKSGNKSGLVVGESPVLVKSAIEVIRETLVESPDTSCSHDDKLRMLKDARFEEFPYKNLLRVNGFRVFVNSSWINHFKYHASIYCDSPPAFINSEYIGDIPDQVLDKALKAKKLSGINYITIHSNQPLPTKFVNFDPVMLGWWTYQHGVDGNYLRTSSSGKLVSPASSSGEAVIIAVWDNDKEIESF